MPWTAQKKLRNVGLESARALVEHYPTEDELRRAVQQDESQIACIKTSSGRRRLNTKVVTSIQSAFRGQVNLNEHDNRSTPPQNSTLTPVVTLERTTLHRSYPPAHQYKQIPAAAPFHNNVQHRDLPARAYSHSAPEPHQNHGSRINPIATLEDPAGSNWTTSHRRRDQDLFETQVAAASPGWDVPVHHRKKLRKVAGASFWTCVHCSCNTNTETDQSCSVCGMASNHPLKRRAPETWTCSHCSYDMNILKMLFIAPLVKDLAIELDIPLFRIKLAIYTSKTSVCQTWVLLWWKVHILKKHFNIHFYFHSHTLWNSCTSRKISLLACKNCHYLITLEGHEQDQHAYHARACE